MKKKEEPIQNKPGYCVLCAHRMKHERLSYEGRTTMKHSNLIDEVGRLPNDESFLQYFCVLQPLLVAQQIIKTV